MLKQTFILSLCLMVFNSYAGTITINDQQQKPLANAVVWLTPADKSVEFPAPTTPFIMTQKDRQFIPHVLVVPQNAQVEFPNADSIMHHVYSFSKAKSFELKLYREQPQDPISFEQTGVVELGCNIHDWMLGYIVVVDSPYYAMTNDKGQIELTLEAGDFTLNIWHSEFSDISKTESKAISLTSAPVVYQIKQAIISRVAVGVDEFDDYE
ncbi:MULTISPECIES: methylamine utilization protein [Pseudoalteromonas]|jgi:plastocyanin|uniref:Methylamine utilization protein n=3 Tax=Pseudoalteromonas TaxID=53246 RepID=A0ABY3F8H7_9GAMM|nr:MULTISPECIES: methylamine utilization protein [Pseudoalteromonas]MBB1303191.1 methylamine utilization protein [Pseudoalteromonas sp. SR44-8]MBB1311362.1 methylamine utilization protein [Pseudoalteromonas sp. SR41-8]MBB1399582.1 methylamine utilization protein [Pseudoalteromonas sp. SG44-8]TVU80359.1 methylamine utilization protein [Pseudoalteromonas neustonica]|tara:strand:+ start:13244 stop:13873 length:630 start_codon:yes stop_codon:yes gene_type:complete